ncbi:MAG: DUF2461 domain-containing protein [Acidimicrobiales bacterium]
MSFEGFSDEAFEFYRGLEAHNSREYWQAHKSTYERAVKEPMLDLIDELREEFGDGRLYRPNRDVRFSKDKSPYKTATSAPLMGGGYVQFSTAGLGVGAGYYMMEPRQLEAFRTAIADDTTGPELESIMATLASSGAELRAHDEPLKTAPRGYPKDHPRIDLLRRKGLIAWWLFEPAPVLGTAGALDLVVDSLRRAEPLMVWLDDNVGR